MRVNGTSYFEISERIGITENSARVIDFRTKKWLKLVLEREGLI
jgi:RNA polymerase sigma-70 factor (ECF subfamily)